MYDIPLSSQSAHWEDPINLFHLEPSWTQPHA